MAHNIARSLCTVTLIILLAFGYTAEAQNEAWDDNAPQLLYRNGENLVLVNGHTGDAETLPGIQAGINDYVKWSPEGKYLIMVSALTVWQQPHCLDIYDVNDRKNISDRPLSCDVESVAMSHDESRIAFSTRASDKENAKLWMHTLNNAQTRAIYTYDVNDPVYPDGYGIYVIAWSPADRYVSFTTYKQIMGGSLNDLHILNVASLSQYRLDTLISNYYATYNPIWSPDEDWFLLDLQEEYVTSGSLPFTNHKGDLYLVRSDTGELHRLTYTPADQETTIGWTDDGQITYTFPQTVMISVDDALKVQAPETVIEPEEVEFPAQFGCMGTVEASNPSFMAEICPPLDAFNTAADELVIRFNGTEMYRAALPSDQAAPGILIGWRPVNG